MSFNFGDGASSMTTSLSRLPVRNEALGDFWVRAPTKTNSVDVGHGLSQGTSLCCELWRRFDTFSPTKSECWWPLFVSSRGLYFMPRCGQHWEPPSQAQIAPTGNDRLEFLERDL